MFQLYEQLEILEQSLAPKEAREPPNDKTKGQRPLVLKASGPQEADEECARRKQFCITSAARLFRSII
jgi:hypothetical protein